MDADRDLKPEEKAALERVLHAADFDGVVALREQSRSVRVVGGTPLVLDLAVEPSAPRSQLPDGPIPGRAVVVSSGGDPEGEIIVWVTAGALSGLEFAWFTDAPPERFPPGDRIQVLS